MSEVGIDDLSGMKMQVLKVAILRLSISTLHPMEIRDMDLVDSSYRHNVL